MSLQKNTYSEMIDKVAFTLYNNGNPVQGYLKNFIEVNKWTFENKRDYERFELAFVGTGWFALYGDTRTYLEDPGIEGIERWGNYLSYEKAQKETEIKELRLKSKELRRKEWSKKFDFATKHTTSIVAILVSISTFILTLFSILDKQERKSLEQEKQVIKSQRDSLIRVLNNPGTKKTT